MSLILGIDIGVNSLGWAIFDEDILKYIDSGVRIYSDINPTGKESDYNLNIERRQYRQRRRLISRKVYRKKLLYKTLKNLGFINNETFVDFVNQIKSFNPYYLRAEGLTRKLDITELSRIFYHYAQRRGFLSNRKQIGSIKEEEKSVVFNGIEETRSQIGDKTLGEYLSTLYPPLYEPFKQNDRIRKRYTSRDMYIDEFNRIWDYQAQFYPQLLTEDNKKIIGDPKKGVLFYQKPLKSQKHLRGKCIYEPDKPRCNISRYEYEEYTFYQFVNNIVLIDEYASKRKLLNEEKEKILQLALNSKSRIKIKNIKKTLKLGGYFCNYEDDAEVPALPFMSFVKQFFPESYRRTHINPDFDNKIDALWQLINYGTDDEWIIKKLKEEKYFPEDATYNFYYNEERINLLKKYHHRNGFGSLSLKAIKNILPFLKEGYLYHIAVLLGGIKNVFGDDYNNLTKEDIAKIKEFVSEVASQSHTEHKLTEKISNWLIENYSIPPQRLKKLYHHTLENIVPEKHDLLPQFTKNIRNPRVTRALFEVRKLINALIKKYGKMDKIVVEIATELRLSPDELNELIRKQNRNKKENEEAKEFLTNKLHIPEPTRDMIVKYRLYQEMLEKSNRNGDSLYAAACPYTGKKIDLENLFYDGIIDIEHIIPYSRSLNDSLANKTLCYADFNRNLKKNLTPYEYFSTYEPKIWEEVKKRAYKLLPIEKYKRFIAENVPEEEDFASSKLNDTRYIAKIVVDFLQQLDTKVQVVAGTITAKVREYWGLNTILNYLNRELPNDIPLRERYYEKNRDDHRHHAVDAMSLCVINKSIVHQLCSLKTREQYEKRHKILERPWKNFRYDVQYQIEKLIISRKQKDKIAVWKVQKIRNNGKVFKVTTFTPKGQLHNETFLGYHKNPETKKSGYVHRIPIEQITKMSQVKRIMDKAIRMQIEEYLGINHLIINNKDIQKGAFVDISKDSKPTYKLYLKNKRGEPVPIKKVRIFEEAINNHPILKEYNKWVEPGSNHHAEIYKTPDGKYYQVLVPFWDAVNRIKNKQKVYGNPENTDQLLFSIKANDIYLLGYPEDLTDYSSKKFISKYLYRVQKITFNRKLESPYYSFRALNAATLNYDYQEIRVSSFDKFKSLNPKRVFINNLGEIEKILDIEF